MEYFAHHTLTHTASRASLLVGLGLVTLGIAWLVARSSHDED
jgi:hypothetical protein